MGFYKKKKYKVDIKLSEKGKKYFNKFENASYEGDGVRMVITGTRGEQWLIDPAKVPSKYKLISGSTYETIPGNEIIEAEPIADGQTVKTSWGDILTSKNSMKCWKKGDLSDQWLVDKEVFADTYESA